MGDEVWTGGCQCGAVRYALQRRPDGACICHCRMCQKQFGSAFGAFASVAEDQFSLTRGAMAWFQSSDEAERGFCRDCGTPLAFRLRSQPRISLAIGTLDRHSEIRPAVQYGIEAREPWFADLHLLPATVTGEGDVAERYEVIRATNHQHPDCDTADWPPHR